MEMMEVIESSISEDFGGEVEQIDFLNEFGGEGRVLEGIEKKKKRHKRKEESKKKK